MMLEYIGWDEAAKIILEALEISFSERKATEDLARFMENGTVLGTHEFSEYLSNICSR